MEKREFEDTKNAIVEKAQPLDMGDPLLMTAFAAAVIGDIIFQIAILKYWKITLRLNGFL